MPSLAPYVMDMLKRADPRRLPRTPKALAMMAAAAVVVLVGLTMLRLGGGAAGDAVVTVAGPGGTDVQNVRVLVDGVPVCQDAPCRVSDLKPGVHLFKVEAEGFRPVADRAFEITSGQSAVVAIDLGQDDAKASATLKVPAAGEGLHLWVDEKDRGALPAELTTVEPGEHLVQIRGADNEQRFEQRVTLEAGKSVTLEPKLDAPAKRAKIALGTDAQGADVSIECAGSAPKRITAPTTVTLEPGKTCQLVASKSGYEKFSQPLKIDEGVAEETFTVALVKSDDADEPAPASEPAPVARPASAAVSRPVARSTKSEASGSGTVNINSIPRSRIIFDGRPSGFTPARITTKPGRHTVMFIHPQQGRKTVSVRVKSGGSATATVRF